MEAGGWQDQVEEALKGGVTFVQLREKDLDEERFLEEAREIKELCGRYQVPFVINDNVDIAQAVDADGVHVGQSDMEAGDVRAGLGRTRSSACPPRRWSRRSWQKAAGRITWEWARSLPQDQRRMRRK